MWFKSRLNLNTSFIVSVILLVLWVILKKQIQRISMESIQSEVWIGMELMASCFDKILKSTKRPIPEPIIGKLTVAVRFVSFRWSMTLFAIVQVITALKYLKDSHGIIHRGEFMRENNLINSFRLSFSNDQMWNHRTYSSMNKEL